MILFALIWQLIVLVFYCNVVLIAGLLLYVVLSFILSALRGKPE